MDVFQLCFLAYIGVISVKCSAEVTVDSALGNDTSCGSVTSVGAEGNPCRTLNWALGASGNACSILSCASGDVEWFDDMLVRLADGVHTLTACISIVNSTNVRFEAITEGQATIRCANNPSTIFDGLFFCGSRNVSFSGIVFEGCGPVSSNVFINASRDILFENCVFRGNTGSPLLILFSTGIRLLGSVFLENRNLAEVVVDDENTTLSGISEVISTGGALTLLTRDEPINVVIQNCTFSSNVANVNAPNNSRPILLKANGHGGAVLMRLVGSRDSSVEISGCVFESNVAEVDGGGFYVSLSEHASSNSITLRDTNFTSNTVMEASGGAVSINSFNFTFNNSLLVERCHFTSNSGDSGGAVSMALYNSNVNSTQFPDALTFRESHFTSNQANNEGTAVGLFSLVHVDQVGFPVHFEDCTFLNNTSELSGDTSAIAAFRFPMVFSRYNRFEGNVGGGITLLNTRMKVTSNSDILFLRNRAVFGAGISMDDRCLLEVSDHVNMTFEQNVATESGGGIYVEFPPIRFVVDIFNRLCFLQYNDNSGVDVPPQEWNNVVIRFSGNAARLSGAAIFASDMQQCAWLGNEFTGANTLIFDPPSNVTEQYPDYPFQYSKNRLFPEGEDVAAVRSRDLATSPANVHAIAPHSLVQPGETLEIDLLATDQVDNSREAIWSVEAPAAPPNLDALSAVNNTYPYVVPQASDLPGVTPGTSDVTPVTSPTAEADIFIQENFSSSFTLNFSLLRTLGTVQSLNLNVSGCHPGYVFNPTTKLCECGSTSNNDILRCDSNMRYLYLREGIWGGSREGENGVRTLITARVQPGYVDCTPQGRLPGCLFMFDDADAQCRVGRQGGLCGECSENRGVTLDLTGCSATSCYFGLGVFLCLCVCVVLVSTLILVFDIELPNELKGFIFYAQVVGLVYGPYVVAQADGSDISLVRILLNLLGLSVPIPLCLSQSLEAHYITLLGYVSPILTLSCVVAFIMGTRFIRLLGRHSALKGITFLSLFFYKYIADTSFIFVSCFKTDMGFVFQYDGTQSCTAPEFIVFFILGLFLVVLFVVPAPFVVSYICVFRPQHFQQYADVLTKGLRTKHHWWGGWDIGRRLPFVFIAFFIVLLRPSVVLFLMSLAALGVLLVHLFTKPFKKLSTNLIEAAILLNLLLVTVAFLDPSNTPVPFAFSVVLLFLPYAYAISYLLYRLLGRRLWNASKKQVSTIARAGSTPADDPPDSGGTADFTGVQRSVSSAAKGSSDQCTQSSVGKSVGVNQAEEMDFANFREPLLDD